MKILKNNLQIAIDGPVAAGKGTVSKLLAAKLGILYIDTGAMYRALAVFIHSLEIEWTDENAINNSLKKYNPKISLSSSKNQEDSILVSLNDQDITNQIRTEKISQGVSLISQFKNVRDYIVPQQQKIASQKSVVMEGRDITTRVLPNADLKIFLDANQDIRAKRRFEQLKNRGEKNLDLQKIKKDLLQRDYQDSHRSIDPLTIAPDAWVLDSSNYSINQVIDLICHKLAQKSLITLK